MLPRAERLTRDSLFQRVYQGKKSISHPPVSLYVLERQPKSAPNLPLVGFVIGKKAHAKAVDRNRAKRRVREAYRLLRQKQTKIEGIAKMSLTQWYALVWQISSEAIEAPFEQIASSIERCLTDAAQKYGRKSPKTKIDA